MATKNNLDVGGEAPHHTELADRYRIEGAVYDLTQIIAAVKGEQSNDDWNARTMGDRLDATKAYLKSVDAEKVEDDAGDEPQQDAPDGDGNNADPLDSEYAKRLERDAALLDAATAATGPVDTLRAFNQDDEAQEVEDLIASNERLTDQIAAIRDRLDAGDGLITDALDALFEKASEAEQRAVAAEQDASQLRGEVQRLRSASTRDKPLHGHVDDLKAPY